ncbi:hypothetical protein KUTeg_014812 [Tegillarca granosa]|uniref:Uncharacterized protein n=1 Tax=Tegillarca granosa TaxID=220873 RepID=A0ABQ9ETC1_TEGGR|nr:hypothetical protein KUTeg_014812 [Tegillarca granosa]
MQWSKKQITNQNELRKLQLSPEHVCTKNGISNQNACPCHCGSKTNEKSNNRTETNTKTANQNTDNKCSEKTVNVASEDVFNNDYFYDEDFTVQFDTNLRESSPGLNCTCIDPALMLDFPHMLTGSYLSFNNIKGSTMLETKYDRYILSG